MLTSTRLSLVALLVLLSACASAGTRRDARDGGYDVVITGGRIVDGTGNPWLTLIDADGTWRRLHEPFHGARGFDTWLETLEARGTSTNVGSFVGASTIRMYAKGMAEGAASSAELDTMRAALTRAMENGAFGGAQYDPSARVRQLSACVLGLYERPHQISEGVRHVLVNGVAVVGDGRHTGATPGRAARMGR